jgi:hypothetical protein
MSRLSELMGEQVFECSGGRCVSTITSHVHAFVWNSTHLKMRLGKGERDSKPLIVSCLKAGFRIHAQKVVSNTSRSQPLAE